MKYLHTMVQVSDIEASLDFYCSKLRLVEIARHDSEEVVFRWFFCLHLVTNLPRSN